LAKVRSVAQRKAIGIVMADVALFYMGNTLLQSALPMVKAGISGGWSDMADAARREAQDYMDRWERWMKAANDSPFYAFTHPALLGSPSENEPGKERKILTGFQSDGTAIYVKNPTGKTTEDMVGWLTDTGQTVLNKLSPLGVRPGLETFLNRDYAGRHIYNPYAETPRELLDKAANIAWHFASAPIPSDMIGAFNDLLRGSPTPDERNIDLMKIIGPISGLMFSKGFPGGPAQGELFRAQQMHQYEVERVMPDVRKDIKEGRIDQAMEKMTEANIPPTLQRFYIDSTLNPDMRSMRRNAQKFMQSLPEEQRDRIQRALERQPQRQ
jgi:hypothetical protein